MNHFRDTQIRNCPCSAAGIASLAVRTSRPNHPVRTPTCSRYLSHVRLSPSMLSLVHHLARSYPCIDSVRGDKYQRLHYFLFYQSRTRTLDLSIFVTSCHHVYFLLAALLSRLQVPRTQRFAVSRKAQHSPYLGCPLIYLLDSSLLTESKSKPVVN